MNVYVVYYKSSMRNHVVMRPAQIIAIVSSRGDVDRIVEQVHRKEKQEGWDSYEIAFKTVPVGMNLVMDGETGSLVLDYE